MMSGITSSSVPDVAPDLPPSLTGAKPGDDLFGSDMDGVVPGPNQDALVDSWMNDDTETSASKGAVSRGTTGLDGSGESDGSSNNNDGAGGSASSGSGDPDHKSAAGNTGASSAPTPPPSSSGMGESGDLENLDLLHDFS
jgi:hypothetical protein